MSLDDVNADLLSGRKKANPPKCQECADILINNQTKLLEFQENEIKCLETYLAQLRTQEPPRDDIFLFTESPASPISNTSSFAHFKSATDSEMADSESTETETTPLLGNQHSIFRCSTEEDTLQEEEENSQAALELASLQRKFTSLQEEANLLETQIGEKKAELRKRQEKLEKANNEYNEQRLLLLDSEEAYFVLDARYQDARYQFERMRRTDVLNVAFSIRYSGHIGVINGLHLGRLPTKPISWGEINAALGQCAMLVQCLAKKLQYAFKQYSIIVMGNRSQITLLSNDKKYPLYNTDNGMRVFTINKFDTALVMFLDCVAQLQALVERPPEFYLPFKVLERGRIEDSYGITFSITYGNNSEENWTEALKMLLINLKFIIGACSTPISSQHSSQAPQTSTPCEPHPN